MTRLLAVAGLCAALVACGASGDEPGDAAPARTPAPAPQVALSADDRRVWAPRPVEDPGVRVLLYRDVAPREFARQLVLVHHAGYRTIGLDELVRFVEREPVSLPPRPLLLTFDGGRLASWTGSDAILRELGFSAVMFVDAGRVLANDPAYLTWGELARLQRSGRWDVQLQSGTGNRLIRYGPGRHDVGPFYAYRGSEEVLGGWRERVFSDITDAEELLVRRVPGYPAARVCPAVRQLRSGRHQRPADPARAAGAARDELPARVYPGPQRLRAPRRAQPDRPHRGQRQHRGGSAPGTALLLNAAMSSARRASPNPTGLDSGHRRSTSGVR